MNHRLLLLTTPLIRLGGPLWKAHRRPGSKIEALIWEWWAA